MKMQVIPPQQMIEVLRDRKDIEFLAFDTETMGHTQAKFYTYLRNYIPHDVDRSPEAVFAFFQPTTVDQTKVAKNGKVSVKKVKTVRSGYSEFLQFINDWNLVRGKGKEGKSLGISILRDAWKVFNGEALDPEQSNVYNLQIGAYLPAHDLLVCTTQSAKESPTELIPLYTALMQSDRPLLAQNVDFDLRQCYRTFGSLPGDNRMIFDTKLIESLFVADEHYDVSVSLSGLCKRHNVPEEFAKTGINPVFVDWRMPTPEQERYALNDIAACAYIFMRQRMMPEAKEYTNTLRLESSVRTRLAHASIRGVPIDPAVAKAFTAQNEEDYSSTLELVIDAAEKVGLPVPKTGAIGKYFGTEEVSSLVLKELNKYKTRIPFTQLGKKEIYTHEDYPNIPQEWKAFLTWKFALASRSKRVSDMHKTVLPVSNSDSPWMHPQYGTIPPPKSSVKDFESDGGKGTKSGRFSTRGFNVLNRSEIEKQYVVAPEGWTIVSLDYSGIEARVAASLARDMNLVNLFNERKDPYRALAGRAFNLDPDTIPKKSKERALGKEGVLAFTYNAGPYTLINQVRNRTKGDTQLTWKEAERIYDAWWELCPDLKRFNHNCWVDACIKGYAETSLGRKRKFNIEEHLKEMRKREKWGKKKEAPLYITDKHGVIYTDAEVLRRASCPKYANLPANHKVQGTAGEGFKHAVSRLPLIERNWGVIGFVHDAFDLLVPSEDLENTLDLIAYIMLTSMAHILQTAGGANIALEVEGSHGRCWAKTDPDLSREFVVPIDTPGYYQKSNYVWRLFNDQFTKTRI
jgi:DNA polymerase I-like protein with 3'-5' exonuclease and polymerase domains